MSETHPNLMASNVVVHLPEDPALAAIAEHGRDRFLDVVAAHPDEYVDICARLASDVPALDRLRTGLREQLRHSPLCSPALFMRPAERHVETLLRDAAAQRFA